MTFTSNPPLMHLAEDTPPELSPIFSFLNTHTNKVYQEGYFLKLNDQDSSECFQRGSRAMRGRKCGLTPCADGRPCADRQWTECYAQLVGTVLSLWDAAALDAAGGEEVPATFINLADASLKMVRRCRLRVGGKTGANSET